MCSGMTERNEMHPAFMIPKQRGDKILRLDFVLYCIYKHPEIEPGWIWTALVILGTCSSLEELPIK
jgi:hypothetical protein